VFPTLLIKLIDHPLTIFTTGFEIKSSVTENVIITVSQDFAKELFALLDVIVVVPVNSGGTLSIIKFVLELFHALSLTTNSYCPSSKAETNLLVSHNGPQPHHHPPHHHEDPHASAQQDKIHAS